MPREAATCHYLNDKWTPRMIKGCGSNTNCLSNQVKSEFYHSHNTSKNTLFGWLNTAPRQHGTAHSSGNGKENQCGAHQSSFDHRHSAQKLSILLRAHKSNLHWLICILEKFRQTEFFFPMKHNRSFPKKVEVHLHDLVWIMEPYYSFIVVSLTVPRDYCHFPLCSARFSQTVNLKSLFHW